MYINRMPILSIIIVLLAFSVAGFAIATGQEPNNTTISELSDSTVNSTLSLYSLFALDISKSGCDPCERMDAALSELSAELSGQVAFGMVDAEKNNATAERYNVTSYPALLIFENGTLVKKSLGFGSKEGIVNTLRKLKPNLNTSRVILVQVPAAKTKAKAEVQKNCSDIEKQNRPIMQAFVVSYCPFGLQMQRVLYGIVSKVPSLYQNIEVRYIVKMADGNVSSMHGQAESDENLRQICIREEQSDKYWKYVSCFVESGNSSQCIKTARIDAGKLNRSLANESRMRLYAMEDFNLTHRFNITGSPTLLLNDEIVSEFGFGGRTEEAVKDLLCCGFSSKPASCAMNLSTEKAKSGFTSKVSKQPSGQAKTPSLKTIPLASISDNNPGVPVLITDWTVDSAIKKYPFFVLMGFADWCGYCQKMNVTILNLSKALQGQATFGLIDVEKNNKTSQKFNLKSYPTLLIFKDGTLVSTQIGYKSTSDFADLLKGLEPGLDKSGVSPTSPLPSVAVQRPSTVIEITDDVVSGNDTTLRYLDRILEAAEINRTTGNTINIFIVNINE